MLGEISEVFIGEIDVEVFGIELDTHQEETGLFVGVFVGVQDVAVVAVDEVGDGGDFAFGVGTTDEQDSGVLHSLDGRLVSRLSCVRSLQSATSPASSEESLGEAYPVRSGWCLSMFGSSSVRS